MNARTFVDSNILLYARDSSEPDKQPIAEAELRRLWESRGGRLSTQVLNEFFVNATQKLKPGLSAEDAWDDVVLLRAWNPLPLDSALLERGFSIHRRHKLSWRDSLIIAAADATGCGTILSEDLSDGQAYDGIEVRNPFKSLKRRRQSKGQNKHQ